MRLQWSDLATGHTDTLDGDEVELLGWMATIEAAAAPDYFLLTPEPVFCLSCLPTDPLACVEVFAERPIPSEGRPVQLAGRLHCLVNDPAGWRYQMRGARLI